MTKQVTEEVKIAIAKELGVKSTNVTLLESSGNIENFKEDASIPDAKMSEERFTFNIHTSRYIDLGFTAQVYCTRFKSIARAGEWTRLYSVCDVMRNETFDNFNSYGGE